MKKEIELIKFTCDLCKEERTEARPQKTTKFIEENLSLKAYICSHCILKYNLIPLDNPFTRAGNWWESIN